MLSPTIIVKYSVAPLQARLTQPFRIASGQHRMLDNLLFTVELSGGIIGCGEAAIATHITGETVGRTRLNLHAMGKELVGKNVFDYAVLAPYLHALFPGNTAAVAAGEMALLDAWAQAIRQPLWKLYGRRPAKLSTDITIVIGSLAEAKEHSAYWYRRGFRAFKIKIGCDYDLDIKRVLAVRASAPKAVVYLDANQGYSAREAIRHVKELTKLGVRPAFIEQPVPKHDWDGLAKVTRDSGIAVCADESVATLDDLRYAVRRKAIGIVNIKLMKSGFFGACRIADYAVRAGLRLMIGSMMESPLAVMAAVHLVSGLRCFSYVDLDTPFFLKRGIRAIPYLSGSGKYDVAPVRAGIGVRRCHSA